MNKAQYYEQVLQMARATSQMIDALSPRGVFKGEELSTIGNMRDGAVRLIAMTEELQVEEAEAEE